MGKIYKESGEVTMNIARLSVVLRPSEEGELFAVQSDGRKMWSQKIKEAEQHSSLPDLKKLLLMLIIIEKRKKDNPNTSEIKHN